LDLPARGKGGVSPCRPVLDPQPPEPAGGPTPLRFSLRFRERCDELDPDEWSPEGAGAYRNSRGLIRLKYTREWFLENNPNLKELVDVFQEWKAQDEYLHLALFRGEDKVKEIAVLCSKRGNRVYVHRVRDRLEPLLSLKLPEGNRSWNKTRFLFVTLTYDTKRCSPREAWVSISQEFNRWITNLRNKFGRVSCIKGMEATQKGYPHIHLLLCFQDVTFSYFALKGKFRIPRKERDRIRAGWHSFVDVEAVISPLQAIRYLVKYLIKAHGGKVEGKTPWEISQEGVSKTLALLWVYKKRGYSLSGDLEEALADLIPRPCVTQTLQFTLDGDPLEKWVFLGVKTAGELGIQDDPPPFFVVLWPRST
jgi:hypothetical protein